MRGARPQRALELTLLRDVPLRDGERVDVALSGGPDSVALAAALHAAARTRNYELALVHVNHQLRPSSWQDEAVALRVAAALRLPIEVVALDEGPRDEGSLRDRRYAALLAAAQRRGATALATAHTAEDQTETLLLALFRGTGPEGLAGIPARRPLGAGVDLCRPFLRADHVTLRRYAAGQGLPWALDPANEAADYRRNAVRQALAELRPLFPGLDRAAARAAELVAAETSGDERAQLRRGVREALRRRSGLKDVHFERIEAAVRAISEGRSGTFELRGGRALIVDDGQARVEEVERPR